MYKISEIFESIQGEAGHAGQLTTFIRFHGCNLDCNYCDSAYATKGNDYYLASTEEIIRRVKELGNPLIELTGGEPLIQENIMELIITLIHENYQIDIETNGSVDLIPFLKRQNVKFIMDIKTPGSGQDLHMIYDNLSWLDITDNVKFVICSIEDLRFVKRTLEKYPTQAKVYLSPCWGKIDPADIVLWMKENKSVECILSLQMHKIIWDKNKRGV